MEIGTARPGDRAATIVLDYATGLNHLGREPVASAPSSA
jgi:hypothetical protein